MNAFKADELFLSLDLVSKSTMKPGERMAALARLFYRLVKSATSEEKILYRNFYARFQYLLSRLALSDEGRRNLDAFRRFIKAEEAGHVNARNIQKGLELVSDLAAMASGRQLQERPAIADGHFSRLFPRRNYAALSSLRILCTGWGEIKQSGGRSCFVLQGLDLLNLQGAIEVNVWRDNRYDYTSIRPLLSLNMIIGLQQVRFRTGSDNVYDTTFDSLITLEPDLLVEATAVGECFGHQESNSDLFFLSRLVPDLPGAPALKGSMIGYFLDEMVRTEAIDRGDVFLEAQRSFALRAAHLGAANMRAIQQSIYQDHLRNILQLVVRERQKALWIEPTYFSVEYGLQGRLDLLSIDETTGTRDIIELKSGKPSNPNMSTAWRNHYMQVVCYDMMLDSTYGHTRKGSGAVYYSACTIMPYRNIVSNHEEKRAALTIRNEQVVKIYRLASGDFSSLHMVAKDGVPGLPVYQQAALQAFRQLYQPTRITTIFYEELLAFTLRELINAKVGHMLKEDMEEQPNGFAGLWLDTLSEKKEDLRIIFDLRLVDKGRDIDRELGDIHLSFSPDPANTHSFRRGDIVILYPRSEDRYNALSQHVLKGSLKEIGREKVVVSLNNKQTDYGFIERHALWAIEPDIFERNHWSVIANLVHLLKASDRQKRILFGQMDPAFDETISYKNPLLTGIQEKSVLHALQARDYYLLQGPPGTGKTSTFLLHYVQESLQRSDAPIVVLAFTNRAVDKICEAFAHPRDGAPIAYLRMGSRYVNDANLFTELLKDDNPDHWKSIIHHHRVFVSTVTTFQNNTLLLKEFINFDQVVIDEASQLTEAVTAGILPLFRKFILIGDYKQLPAVITQDEQLCLTKNDYLHQLAIVDLRQSLFERLIQTAKKKGRLLAYGQLKDHYRMHDHIAALISDHYQLALEAGLPEQWDDQAIYSLPSDHRFYPLCRQRAVFIESFNEGSLKRNEPEAQLVADILKTLVETAGLSPAQIGVITPFRAQIVEIRRRLKDEWLADDLLTVDTVERFQGDERDVIIFSTVVGHGRQVASIQSMHSDEQHATDRKLLVSISRAARQFILLGNAGALTHSGAYRELLGRLQQVQVF